MRIPSVVAAWIRHVRACAPAGHVTVDIGLLKNAKFQGDFKKWMPFFTPFPDTLWVRKEIKFGYSCSLCKILRSWYRQSSFLHSATPRARDGLSVSLVQDFAEKALGPKLDSYNSPSWALRLYHYPFRSRCACSCSWSIIDPWRSAFSGNSSDKISCHLCSKWSHVHETLCGEWHLAVCSLLTTSFQNWPVQAPDEN